MNKEILAVMSTISANPFSLANDRIEALTKSHGMLSIAAMAAANVMIREIFDGASIKISNPNFVHLPLENVITAGVEAAKAGGADAANAALIVALQLNIAGTKSRAGVPAGNRKLGAMARMIAGAGRGGVATLPTGKRTAKLSGIAAVNALYDAMAKGELVRFSGADVPPNISGSANYGHGSLGEDILYEDLARNGTRIAFEAMKRSYHGVGIAYSPIMCALFAAAAVMEISNVDGSINPAYGDLSKGAGYLIGKGAVEAANLPKKLHLRGTRKEYDTAVVISDVAMILKDVGSPSVVGMIYMNDVFASFEEASLLGAGSGAGPGNPPMGHLSTDTIVAMNALLDNNGDVDATADIVKDLKSGWFDPEVAAICANLMAHKGEQLCRGLVTRTLITAFEGIRTNAIYNRAERTYNELRAGKKLEDICRTLDIERKTRLEERAGKIFSKNIGKNITIRITKVEACGRGNHPFHKRYWAFDPNVDVEVTIDGQKAVLAGFHQNVLPDVVLNKKKELSLPVSIAGPVINELLCAGCCTIDAFVPAAMAAVMGIESWEDAGKLAEKGAKIAAGIPGTQASASEVAKLAQRMMKDFV
jgi:hypothetical protein